MAGQRALKPDPDFARYRANFPMLATQMQGKPLAFLDTAASAQKPRAVIDAMTHVAESDYSNIHRGLYQISQRLTVAFEDVRNRVARFINAPSESVIFTRNATEGINLVAQSWGGTYLQDGDEVILSVMEHHANIVPWQLLQKNKKIEIKVIPLLEDGTLDLAVFGKLLSPRTKLVAITHISNALGTINPVKEIIQITKDFNPSIKVLIDGSQGIVHSSVNMQDLGCDFYVFTGHKLYGPTGIGVLYGKYDVLESMPPYQGGGDMIERVSFAGTTFKKPPARFEAGTPAIIEVMGLGAAIDYVEGVGLDKIAAHEAALLEYATEKLQAIEGVRIFGPKTTQKAGIISFRVGDVHPSDTSMVLDKMGVAIRAGHHCCMPLMQTLGVDATVRASFGLYSNKAEIDQLLNGIRKVKELLA